MSRKMSNREKFLAAVEESTEEPKLDIHEHMRKIMEEMNRHKGKLGDKVKRFGQFESITIGQRTVQSYNTLDNGTSALSVRLRSLGDLSDYRMTGQADSKSEMPCVVGDMIDGFVYDTNNRVRGRITRILRGEWGYKVYVMPEGGHEETRVEPFDMDILKSDPTETPAQSRGDIEAGGDYNNFYT